jgi:hypothetical protein
LADKFKPEVNFNGLTLRQAELSSFVYVERDLAGQRLGIGFLLRNPHESRLLN